MTDVNALTEALMDLEWLPEEKSKDRKALVAAVGAMLDDIAKPYRRRVPMDRLAARAVRSFLTLGKINHERTRPTSWTKPLRHSRAGASRSARSCCRSCASPRARK